METFGGIGKMLMVVGATVLLIGAIVALIERGGAGPLSWLGRLPGDLFIKREHVTVYVPLATSVVISVVLSLLAWLLFRR
jgi:hypothetical protein